MSNTSGIDLGPLVVDESTVTYLDYCTLAEVETYIGVNFSDGIGPTDTQIATMITNASRLIDTYAGTQIGGTATATEYFDVTPKMEHLVLSGRPCRSITSIAEVSDSGTETALVQGRVRNTDDYFLHDQTAGIVRFLLPFDIQEKQRLKVVYVFGNSTIPAEVKMATIMMVARNAARAALNDENCMERVKEMWMKLLASTEADLKEYLDLVKRGSLVGVATFGLKGGY